MGHRGLILTLECPTTAVSGWQWWHSCHCLEHFFFFPLKFLFIFWLHHEACGVLVSWSGIEPMTPEVEAGSLNHWATGKVPMPEMYLKEIFAFLFSFSCMHRYTCHKSKSERPLRADIKFKSKWQEEYKTETRKGEQRPPELGESKGWEGSVACGVQESLGWNPEARKAAGGSLGN